MADIVRGMLLSGDFIRTVLPTLPGARPPSVEADRLIEQAGRVAEAALGPASSARAVADAVVLPLLRALGFVVLLRHDRPGEVRLDAGGNSHVVLPTLVRGWTVDLDTAWRDAVRTGIAADARWCLVVNGRQLRVVDAQHTWSRHFLEIDFVGLGHDATARRLLWMVGCAEAMAARPAVLDTASKLSSEHGVAVCRALGEGVVAALGDLFATARRSAPTRTSSTSLIEQCLTVIFRIVFLLFAEARALVPVWHPLYRDRYTIGAIVSALIAGRSRRGVWSALQAISRMAHSGCKAGTLSVTAFNGRLFAPAHAPRIEDRLISDEMMGDVVLRLGSSKSSRSGITRTRYDELDVEQLGAIYEQVLEYQPVSVPAPALRRTRDTRKASGTFYTPRDIAASLIEHTLAPLLSGRSASEILNLRVLDPAMGSGAFLVATCRYLARRAEQALIEEGTWHATEVTEADRTMLRREIAQRCLYGVDLNPIAVQLARLSLWLVALAHDKPLTFLDHHLVVGNSLVGAAPSDIHRNTGGRRAAPSRPRELPLFDESGLATSLAAAGRVRRSLALQPDDSAAVVRTKERRLASLMGGDSTLGSWKRVLDLWCATWFWGGDSPPGRAVFADVTAYLLTGRSSLAPRLLEAILGHSDRRGEEERFLHWPVAFPEVFHDEQGHASESTGFDAVIGNPPWDMLRGDSGDDDTRAFRRRAASGMTRFVRDSGIYRTEARAHVNRYALFTERALRLTRNGGRLGLVLPGGVLTDPGTAPLRMQLLSHSAVDDIVGFDNRSGIFPIHRSMRFVLLTATVGGETHAVRCRFGVSRPDELERSWNGPTTLTITRSLLERISGGSDLGIPHLTSREDLALLEAITASVPMLSDPAGWRARFGRELNATDDRSLMVPASQCPDGRPVVEGKVLSPFRVAVENCSLALASDAPLRPVPRRQRLAYREIAGAGNRLTLIAAIVPSRAVTTHTVFCLKSSLTLDSQRVLCGLLNSFVANYLVRMRVGTHVTATMMAGLRVPFLPAHSEAFSMLLEMSSALIDGRSDVEDSPVFARLQAAAAKLYGLRDAEFAHVLGTFPLIPAPTKDACLAAFRTDVANARVWSTSRHVRQLERDGSRQACLDS